jgi:hypothetical protein
MSIPDVESGIVSVYIAKRRAIIRLFQGTRRLSRKEMFTRAALRYRTVDGRPREAH